MLDHSSGSAQLSLLKLSQPDVDRYAAAIARLPSKAIAIARRLIEQHTDGTEFPTEIFELNEKQLGQLFTVFFGKLTSAAQATWQAIGCGTYLPFARSGLYRSPKFPRLTQPKQEQWISHLIELKLDYPEHVTTAEGLAVWAPYFDHRPMGSADLLGMNMDAIASSAYVGRLLAKVIDQPDSAGANVLDTLRLTLDDRHPASMFGLHAIYALWCSAQPEANQLIFDKLTRADAQQQLLILRAGVESSFENVGKILRYVRNSELIENQRVGEELLAWLGFFGSEYDQEALCNCIDLALAAWEDTQSPGGSTTVEVKLFHAWSVMTREVDDALPWLLPLMKSEPSEHRSRILNLVELSMHPSSGQLFLVALNDPDLNLVTRALSALSSSAHDKKANETERRELLQQVAAACRLAYPEKDKFPHLFQKEEPAFFEALEALLRKLLMND